jgi:phage terminase large subunit
MLARIKTGTIFNKTKAAFDGGKKIVIHRGGTGSGKTYDIILFLFSIAITTPDKIITVVSESRPHLDIGAIRILSGICKGIGLWTKSEWNASTAKWTSPTGSIIEFFSADRIDKALGARRDWLYGNEINSLKKDVWDELARRSENVIGDFNPTAQFWIEDWLANYDKTLTIKSNYLDNPFLPDTERARIAKRISRDENFKRIHFDCEYGVTEGIIFSNWFQVDSMPDGDATYGLDFGFTNDPTSLIKVIETEEAFYLDELIYQTGLLNSDIIRMFGNLGLRKNYDEIIADSAEPKSIQELCNAGYNVKGAVKGPDSIKKGIDTLMSKPIYITKRSTNLIKEFRSYSWALNKDGRPTNKPIDAYNHGIDAVRYAVMHQHFNNFDYAIC